jgi:hypothetical protein
MPDTGTLAAHITNSPLIALASVPSSGTARMRLDGERPMPRTHRTAGYLVGVGLVAAAAACWDWTL